MVIKYEKNIMFNFSSYFYRQYTTNINNVHEMLSDFKILTITLKDFLDYFHNIYITIFGGGGRYAVKKGIAQICRFEIFYDR